MTLPAPAAVSPPVLSIGDAFAAVLVGFRQIGEGMYALAIAIGQNAAGFGARLLQHPTVLASGIVIGAAACLAALLITVKVRGARQPARALSPQHGGAPPAKPQNQLQTLAMAEVEKQLGSSPEGLTQGEAAKRLTQYGLNELVEQKTNRCWHS